MGERVERDHQPGFGQFAVEWASGIIHHDMLAIQPTAEQAQGGIG